MQAARALAGPMMPCSTPLVRMDSRGQNRGDKSPAAGELMAGTYSILGSIGSGGFGEVFRARMSTGQLVAVKQLTDHYVEEDKRRFTREVRIQTALDHRNIVTVFDDRLEDEPPTFSMPLAEGNLEDYLDRKGHGEGAVWAVYDIAAGVKHAHDNNVIHRDLSARNVLYYTDASGAHYMAVADFGLGRQLDSGSTRLTRTLEHLGTVAYVAPEQIRDLKSATECSDIYSLGKLLYKILTGETPFPDIDYDLVPAPYRYIIRKACAVNPTHRYQGVAGMLVDLDRVVERDVEAADPVAQLTALIAKSPNAGVVDLQEVKAVINDNIDDFAFLTRAIPTVDAGVVERMLADDVEFMVSLMTAYDVTVSGTLPFEYCDVVARFYARVFKQTDNYEIRSLIVRRLIKMGRSHNRFFVRDKVAALARDTEDVAVLMEMRDLIRENDPEYHDEAVRVLRDRGVWN